MNFKTTYLLFGSLLVLLGIAALSLLIGPRPGAEGALLSGFKAANVQAKDVTRVAIDRHLPTEQRLVFVRTDKDHWKLEEPYSARVDAFQVERMIGDLLGARKETKNVDLTSNLAQFGLDRPAVTVTLTAGDRIATVNFGKMSFGSADSSVVYATSSDAPKQPAAIRRSSLRGLLKDSGPSDTAGDALRTVSDFRPRDLILERATNPAAITRSVRVKGPSAEIVVNKTSDGKWQYEKPAGFGDADLDGDTTVGAGGDVTPTGVKPLLDSIARIQAGSGDDYVENVTDFSQYGLTPGQESGGRIEIVRDNPAGADAPPITESLAIGKKDEASGRVFVRAGDDSAVVKVSAPSLEPINKLLARPDALRDRNLLSVAATAADGVDIQIGADPPIELRKVGEPPAWRIFNSDGSSVAASAQAVTAVLNALSGKRGVKDFPASKPSDNILGFDHPSVTVTLWVGGILSGEKKDGEDQGEGKAKDQGQGEGQKEKGPLKPNMKEPTVKLIFGKTDKDLLYVRRVANGASTDLAVSESLLGVVRRGRLDYLDVVLPSFVGESATQLTLTIDGAVTALERQKQGDAGTEHWVIQQPSNLAGRPVDRVKLNRLLGDLSALRIERLWAEKATEKELERFGLQPPRMSAVVKLKDEKDPTRTYLFGAESDDKATVYAKLGERDWVFSVRRGVVDALKQLDLVDPTVFTLDLSKVRGMKLTGWKDFSVNGQPQVLDLVRKSANDWAVSGSGGYKLSSPAAAALLLALQSVRAEKVVEYKAGPKPEHKLTADAGALVIELTLDGEKEPITLALGALDPDGKHYFAMSNKLPGDVFLLPKDRFEKYKTRPNALAAE